MYKDIIEEDLTNSTAHKAITVSSISDVIEEDTGYRPLYVKLGYATEWCKCPRAKHNDTYYGLRHGFAVPLGDVGCLIFCAGCSRLLKRMARTTWLDTMFRKHGLVKQDDAPEKVEPISYGDNVIAFPNRKQRDDLRTGI